MVAFLFFLQNSDQMLAPLPGLFQPELSLSFPYHRSVDDSYLFTRLSPPSDFELSKSSAMFGLSLYLHCLI